MFIVGAPYYPAYYYPAPAYAYAPAPAYMVPAAAPAVQQPAYAQNQYCREYTKTLNIAGQIQQSYGTACMQPDGSWQIVN